MSEESKNHKLQGSNKGLNSMNTNVEGNLSHLLLAVWKNIIFTVILRHGLRINGKGRSQTTVTRF